MGRPSTYTPELADLICLRLSGGESLREMCKSGDMPDESTVRQWARDDVEGFYPHYSRARDIGLDCKADEYLEVTATPVEATIVTDTPRGREIKTVDAVDRSRLHADGLKWYLSHLAPKRYGDRLALEHSGEIGTRSFDDEERIAKIDAIFAAIERRTSGDAELDGIG